MGKGRGETGRGAEAALTRVGCRGRGVEAGERDTCSGDLLQPGGIYPTSRPGVTPPLRVLCHSRALGTHQGGRALSLGDVPGRPGRQLHCPGPAQGLFSLEASLVSSALGDFAGVRQAPAPGAATGSGS